MDTLGPLPKYTRGIVVGNVRNVKIANFVVGHKTELSSWQKLGHRVAVEVVGVEITYVRWRLRLVQSVFSIT